MLTLSLRTIAIALLLAFFNFSNASVPEYFGTSAKSMGLGGQATGLSKDASNNYYMASQLAYTNETSYSVNFFAVQSQFDSIENVVIRNQISTGDLTPVIGNVDTEDDLRMMLGLHGSFSLFKKWQTKLGLSLFAPAGDLAEINSGDPFLPEYALYKSRYYRPQVFGNIIQRFNPTSPWAASLGVHAGFATSAETFLVTRLNGDTYPSWAKAKVKVKPAIGLLASLSYKLERGYLGVAFQQGIKSKLDANAVGLAPLGGASSLAFAADISSLVAYDPMILRATWSHAFTTWKIVTSLEYQFWDNYESSHLQIASGSVVNGTRSYEQLETQNIFIPKIGAEWRIDPKFSIRAGYFYRPTPLVKDHSLAGNTLDADVHALSLGLGYMANIAGQGIEFSLGFQYQQLVSEHVEKVTTLEDGTPGQMIGSGGYDIGGSIIALSLGAKWSF